MKAKNDDVSESYMLAGGFTDDGQWLLDEPDVADLLDLFCSDQGAAVTIDETKFEQHLSERRVHLEREVQGRNSRYYDQQEKLLYRNQLSTAGQSQRERSANTRPANAVTERMGAQA